ncbi:hypothetical protein AQJ43_32020 [Streptomyces avermitilis]|uniref:Uncharacterized protein n=1 Tax=Streptomyces avermitilis TaxID=33903 RepID=A0A4D4N7W6_STRAX|nr:MULTISPECIES: hypothetical protein [Streptomyces]KUN50669.1 hypothetical protein AQJ43_32020 [Streptomyces avermitilis]MYS96395.1 hypothetical protein [Streptomyces sp. SID5469]OOV20855.1 hypothetical protein SM007_36060 [Streptomyces avermitilis]BBJ48298.1 hypothetical protein SAVMC3_09270 [Streptomyces avermitilis]GDY69334.1 hypothetical protein SAV14893_087270 [Streptomyces avermitilis]
MPVAFRVQTLEAGPDPHQAPDVGIDLGVTLPITLSEGETHEPGEWLTRKEQAGRARVMHATQSG